MKNLIVYFSKYGCTADCAGYLKSKLQGDVNLIDINAAAQIDISLYDSIIIGSSVYVGKVSKKLRKFCEDNLAALTKKRIGIFLCCALADQADEFFTDNFPPALLDGAVIKKVFGSDARLEKMSFLDKTMIKLVTKGDFSNFKISHESIDEFAREFYNKP